jgi:hypothetical protein
MVTSLDVLHTNQGGRTCLDSLAYGDIATVGDCINRKGTSMPGDGKGGMRNESTKSRGNYDYKGGSPNKWMVLPDQISMHNLKLAPHPRCSTLLFFPRKFVVSGAGGVVRGGIQERNVCNVFKARRGGRERA